MIDILISLGIGTVLGVVLGSNSATARAWADRLTAWFRRLGDRS